MRRLPGVLSVVAVGIFATGTTAQERADFSGAWTSGPARATRGGQGGGAPSGSLGSGWGQEFTITQGNAALGFADEQDSELLVLGSRTVPANGRIADATFVLQAGIYEGIAKVDARNVSGTSAGTAQVSFVGDTVPPFIADHFPDQRSTSSRT